MQARWVYNEGMNIEKVTAFITRPAHSGHTFECFWAPLYDLPDIIPPQNEWFWYVSDVLGYRFVDSDG